MERFPTLFVSHGAPSYALEPGVAGAVLATVGRALPRPNAVLVVSPHWMTAQPCVTTAPQPATIHDFAGFGKALNALQYPASGHPHLAQRACELLTAAGWPAQADAYQGFDHGAWVPLLHLYPKADVPVFQVSLPAALDAQQALEYGAALAPLRDEGVLIVGSGSLTHNLYEFFQAHGKDAAYASEFVAWIRDAVEAGDRTRLVNALTQAPHAQRAHPTPEHFLPLLVACGAAQTTLPVTVLPGEMIKGVLSMESYVFGGDLSPVLKAFAHGFDA
ncbi:MAG: class III extradiol ring-cleavage dioxygenase [Gammaproteobacteria bacterium]